MKNQKSRLGLTAIEVCVVLAIIGLLIGMLVPALQKSKRNAELATKREGEPAYSPAAVITIGKNSYIRLDLLGAPHQNAGEILRTIAAFEKSSGKEVSSWNVEVVPSGQTRGIWVHHPTPPPILLEQ